MVIPPNYHPQLKQWLSDQLSHQDCRPRYQLLLNQRVGLFSSKYFLSFHPNGSFELQKLNCVQRAWRFFQKVLHLSNRTIFDQATKEHLKATLQVVKHMHDQKPLSLDGIEKRSHERENSPEIVPSAGDHNHLNRVNGERIERVEENEADTLEQDPIEEQALSIASDEEQISEEAHEGNQSKEWIDQLEMLIKTPSETAREAEWDLYHGERELLQTALKACQLKEGEFLSGSALCQLSSVLQTEPFQQQEKGLNTHPLARRAAALAWRQEQHVEAIPLWIQAVAPVLEKKYKELQELRRKKIEELEEEGVKTVHLPDVVRGYPFSLDELGLIHKEALVIQVRDDIFRLYRGNEEVMRSLITISLSQSPQLACELIDSLLIFFPEEAKGLWLTELLQNKVKALKLIISYACDAMQALRIREIELDEEGEEIEVIRLKKTLIKSYLSALDHTANRLIEQYEYFKQVVPTFRGHEKWRGMLLLTQVKENLVHLFFKLEEWGREDSELKKEMVQLRQKLDLVRQ